MAIAFVQPPNRLQVAASTWLAGLLTIAPVLPVAAGAVTVLLHLTLSDDEAWFAFLYTAASILAVVLFLPLLFGGLASFRRANSASAADLLARTDALDQKLGQLPEPSTLTAAERNAWIEVKARRREIDVEGGRPSLRWALGFGYIDMWTALHRAEEALTMLEPRPLVVARARRDRLRIDGSTIGQSKDLLKVLEDGLKDLSSADLEAQSRGRAQLGEVRRAVNEFRDDAWNGLVRARNATNAAVIAAGVVAYALLTLAIIRDVERAQIATGVGIFFFGVLFGFLNRLYDPKTERTVEDYGLANARLPRTLLYSGLAAVGGVVVVAMARATVNDFGGDVKYPTLTEVFSIDKSAFRLVLAAAFGVSPELLLRFVERQGEQLKDKIRLTEAGSAMAGGEGTPPKPPSGAAGGGT